MSYDYDKIVGSRIRQYREQADLTQNELSARLQVRGHDKMTRGAISKIEISKRHIYLHELAILKDVLGVNFEDLLKDLLVCK